MAPDPRRAADLRQSARIAVIATPKLRPLYLPPDPASRTSYPAGETAQCYLWFPNVVVPVGFAQVRTATALPVLTMVCEYSRWASAVLITTRAAEDLYAGCWHHLSMRLWSYAHVDGPSPQPTHSLSAQGGCGRLWSYTYTLVVAKTSLAQESSGRMLLREA